MVLAHTARPHAAKSHMACGEMHDAIVHAAAAKGHIAGKALLHRTVLAKDIQRKRRGAVHNKTLDLVQTFIGDDWQYRTKNLFLHHGVNAWIHTIENRWLNLKRRLVRAAAQHNLGGVDKPAHAIEMLGVDHLAVGGVAQRILAIHGANATFESLEQLVVHALVHQQIIGCHTGLAHIEPLAKSDTTRCHLDVCRGIHDAGAFAAQLQRHRREIAARLLHHKLAHVHASGKEDLVPTLLQQGCILGTTALDYAHKTRVERLLANLAQNGARGRRVSARLEDHSVARSEGARQGLERKQERIVPRRHNKRHAIGHGLDLAHAHGVREVAGAQARAAPRRNMGGLMANLGKRRANLAHIGFTMTFAQVGIECSGDVVLMRSHALQQRA